MAEVVDTLKRVPLFAGFSGRDLKRVAKNMTEREFPAGAEITTQGEDGVGFFVIDGGNAAVRVGGEVVRTLGPGEYFGEIAMIDKGPRSATVVATSPLRCRGLTAWAFRPLLQTHPEMAWPMLEALVARLRETESEPN
jgi:CRP/FNR family transcriptional regulator, cyclic AMP receptor protein